MNFLKIKTCWSNAEFIIIKICMATIYIFVGSYFHDFFQNYHWALIEIFAFTVIWFVYQWIKKMKSQKL
ncbi:hypothetical protein K6T82_23385 [Flavobacterium sp. 17A]|uniref:Uncharacterized protein n=1 Tax=Flavobacterium potami TaxID=2872310 RepID=A0A9X1HFV9_9FLAO|nr:hypothetical protein [Flavobacterium potami]MBZ4037723.1 hypothetical protein [Flavobacterium potami]